MTEAIFDELYRLHKAFYCIRGESLWNIAAKYGIQIKIINTMKR